MKLCFFYIFIELELIEEELRTLTLIEIENILQANRRSLKDFNGMPYPNSYITRHIGNRLIYEERDYNVDIKQQIFHDLFRSLTCSLFTTSTIHIRKLSY